jgi:DNA-binding MarR family transcriptional regulator
MDSKDLLLQRLLSGSMTSPEGQPFGPPHSRLDAESDTHPMAPGENVDLRLMARQIYRSRRDRDTFFDPSLMGEPVWDMLLAVYSLPTRSRPMTVSGLCGASACPPSTALRWIECMIERGLIERHSSESDRRVTYVSLTAQALEKIEGYLMHLAVRYAQPRLD